MSTGYTVYQGPSALDGSPIVAVVTLRSSNTKTGDMAQLWILPALANPVEAVKRGVDASVCGDCKHRGVNGSARTCYVNVGQAPLSVYRAYTAGRYTHSLDAACDAIAYDALKVRLGAYGDPAALPLEIIARLASASSGWTGYTHQWKSRPELARYCMASVDSLEEQTSATALGWRCFRVLAVGQGIDAPDTILCPSDKVQCSKCRLCAGTSRPAKSIAIEAHGSGKKYLGQVGAA
jgi:hypothetical protein